MIGDFALPFTVDDKVLVSSVNEELLTLFPASFFDDGFLRRKDFHECALGLCGDVGVCMLRPVGDAA